MPRADLDQDQIRAAFDLICQAGRIAALLPVEVVEQIVEQAAFEDAFLPFFDPTKWMQSRDNVKRNVELVEAFLVFRRKLETFRPELERARG